MIMHDKNGISAVGEISKLYTTARDGFVASAYVCVNGVAQDGEKYEVLYLIHGVEGNARSLIKRAKGMLDVYAKKPYILIAPELGCSESSSVGLGNMCKSGGGWSLNDSDEWTFNAVDAIYDKIQKYIPVKDKFCLFGHSAGAQFAHRYVLFGDTRRLKLAVAANAGWYTVLSMDTKFPYGIKNIDINKEACSRNLVILLGTSDILADSHFRTTNRANKQGGTRFGRGRYFYSVAQDYSKKAGLRLNWSIDYVDGAGHNSSVMLEAAMKRYFLRGI